MLTLGIDYLTGYATATSAGDRNLAEWPPHPGRIFMAMAAAYFETRPDASETSARTDWENEADALRWLERLDAPAICAAEIDKRDVVEVFVPPNDMGPTKRTSVPAYRTNRQPRTFPKVRPHESRVYLHWAEVDLPDQHRAALERVCAKVIRIGHSSSLVRMWLSDEDPPSSPNFLPVQNETGSRRTERFRVAGAGCLDYLRDQYNGEAVDRFYEFHSQIQTAKGKEQKALKIEFEKQFGMPWEVHLAAPASRRPILSMTQAYRRTDSSTDPESPSATSVFDDALLVLDKREGPALGLESTWQLLTALRGAIEKNAEPTPEWVSGHQPDGRPSEQPHLALLPLGFVGSDYADGHLLGVALAFPRSVSLEERGKLVGKLLYDATGRAKDLRLTLGKLGVWTLGEEERPSPPIALRSATWTGPAKIWASVSPVVLDRHPKADPRKDRSAYIAEVAAIVSASCQRIGLPAPAEIDIDKTSWHRGAPRAKPGPDGFQLMPQRPGGPNRRQVHVWLRFEQPVLGPVLLGAGRYRGYGLCKPWRKGKAE